LKRNSFLDILKGITIILVVIGHSIQYGNGIKYMNNEVFFSNTVFRIIYTFHMPLFMLISGYLFYFSITKHQSNKIIKNKIERLIIPIFIWTIIYNFILFILGRNDFNILSILNSSFYNLTFLWSLFFSSLTTLLIYKVYNDSKFSYLIAIFITLIITNGSTNFTSYLLPYFFIGFEYNKYKDKINKYLTKRNQVFIFLIVLILFALMFKYFTYDKYIYTTTYSIVNNFNNLYINLFRFIIGILGSILVIFITKAFYFILEKIKILEIIGRNTMGIYIISVYINYLFLCEYLTKDFSFSYKNVLIESIIILIITTLISIILRKNKITKKYLLGE